MSTPWIFAALVAGALTMIRRARFQPRLAIGRRDEHGGVADRRRFRYARGGRLGRGSAARRRPDRSRDVRNGADRARARFKRGLPAHDLFEFLVELFLIQQLPAGRAIDLGAKFRDPVLVGVLHFRLSCDQPRQHIVTKREIGRGRRRPHSKRGDGADHDPERHRPEADLLAGMDQRVAVLFGLGGGMDWPAGGRAAAGPDLAAGDTRTDDRNDTTSTLPCRSEEEFLTAQIYGSEFGPVMVNFSRIGRFSSSSRLGGGKHVVGVSVDPARCARS